MLVMRLCSLGTRLLLKLVPPPVMVLDPVAPVAKPTVLKVDTYFPCPSANLSNPPLKAPLSNDGLMTLPRSENLAWIRFKQVVRNEDIYISYDMFVKEFEHSTIHDIFKVNFVSSILSYVPRLQVAF